LTALEKLLSECNPLSSKAPGRRLLGCNLLASTALAMQLSCMDWVKQPEKYGYDRRETALLKFSLFHYLLLHNNHALMVAAMLPESNVMALVTPL
jgi:hypothetical protein